MTKEINKVRLIMEALHIYDAELAKAILAYYGGAFKAIVGYQDDIRAAEVALRA